MIYAPGTRDVAPGMRLHPTIDELCVVLDAIFVAGEVALGLQHTPPLKGHSYSLESARFPLLILLPIAGPFYLAATNNAQPRTYQVQFTEHEPQPPGPTTPQLRTVHHMAFSSIFVVFYERYRPWLQGKFGRDVKSWPAFFRFCWAIRNACTHHDGRINFTNPESASVSWAGLTYSPADNGKQVI
jgi:hypothetical protein